MGIRKHVKSYNDYLDKLKRRFFGLSEMPSDDEIRSFMDEYDLYNDWHIQSIEVRSDIHAYILSSKTKADASNIELGSKLKSEKKTHISGYKDYLIKLKERFGIPKYMPEFSLVEAFVNDYSLYDDWGITAVVLVRDLKGFIEGKYEEMLEDASHKSARPSYNTVIYTSKRVTSNKPPVEPPKPLSKKTETKFKEIETTIFLDGDNHINEGEQGIELMLERELVRAFFCQDGAKSKFDEKHKNKTNVSSILVVPGPQAVDNRIKAEVGNLLIKGNQNIGIVSHDKGYDDFIENKSGKNENVVQRATSIASILDVIQE